MTTKSARKGKKRFSPAVVPRSLNLPQAGRFRNWKSSPLPQVFQAFLIVALGTWAYLPVLQAGWFIDDNLYLTANPLLQDPWRLWKAWFQPGSFIEYYPLEQSVQWMQWLLWHRDAFGYHATNLVLHLVNALLVWRLFARLGLRLAWVSGLIFALHPLQVESVAWISELKNTLSLAPFLLAMCFYLDFDARRRVADYLPALGFFLTAMLCKASVAPFPGIILLYAWWKRGRIARPDLEAAAPFFLISLVLGYATIWSGSHYGLAQHLPHEIRPLAGFFPRLILIGLTASFYLAHALFPINPLPAYPLWPLQLWAPFSLLAWLVFGLAAAFVWSRRRTWGRHVILSVGFFLLGLAPFLGLTAVSYMNSTWVMDHFVYFPLIGLIGLTVAALEDLGAKVSRPLRNAGIAGLAAALGWLGFQSHAYAVIFADPLKLWPYTLAHNSQSWMAYYNLAAALPDTPATEAEILSDDRQALALNPTLWPARNDLGIALLRAHRPAEAADEFRQALAIWPEYDLGHMDLGLALAGLNRDAEAAAEFREAIRCNPGLAAAHLNLGRLYLQTGRKPEGLDQYLLAIRLEPHNPRFQYSLANALSDGGRIPEAISHYEEAIRLAPGFAEAHDHLGDALLQTGQMTKARAEIDLALKLKPNDADAHVNLAALLFESGDVNGSIQELKRALALDPSLVSARLNLGAALYKNGQRAESAEQIKEAFSRAARGAGTPDPDEAPETEER